MSHSCFVVPSRHPWAGIIRFLSIQYGDFSSQFTIKGYSQTDPPDFDFLGSHISLNALHLSTWPAFSFLLGGGGIFNTNYPLLWFELCWKCQHSYIPFKKLGKEAISCCRLTEKLPVHHFAFSGRAPCNPGSHRCDKDFLFSFSWFVGKLFLLQMHFLFDVNLYIC